MTSSQSLTCFHCLKKVPVLGAVARRDECPFCRSDLHVCKNCEFYDSKVYNECRENQADVVREKERANFCDYFRPGSGSTAQNSAEALRAAAEALFKKSN